MKHKIIKESDMRSIEIQREYKCENGTVIIGICIFPGIDDDFPRKENYLRTVYLKTHKKKMTRLDLCEKSKRPFRVQIKQWFRDMKEKDKHIFGVFEKLVDKEIDILDEMELWLCMI